MTLVIGLVAKDGIVLASDSQATIAAQGQHLRGEMQKIHVVGGTVAYGIATDHISTKQLIDEKLADYNDYANQPSGRHLRDKLTERVNEVLAAQSRRTVPTVGQAGPATVALFGCYARRTPHLFEVSANGLCTDYAADFGYAAIGSGDIFTYHAMSTFAGFTLSELPVDQAKVLAYRIVFDAVRVAASGIGPPVQMACITRTATAGAASVLTTEELEQLDYQMGVWRRLEREALAEVGLADLAAAEESAMEEQAAEADPAP